MHTLSHVLGAKEVMLVLHHVLGVEGLALDCLHVLAVEEVVLVLKPDVSRSRR